MVGVVTPRVVYVVHSTRINPTDSCSSLVGSHLCRCTRAPQEHAFGDFEKADNSDMMVDLGNLMGVMMVGVRGSVSVG
jgi:hypothetical protein